MAKRFLVFVLCAVVAIVALATLAFAQPPQQAVATRPASSVAPAASASASASAPLREAASAIPADTAEKGPKTPPTKVFIGYHVIDIRSVDLHDQNFYADFYMWVRFSGADDDRTKSIKEKIEFMNGKPDNVTLTDEKTIGGDTQYLCWRVQGTFDFSAHLQKYPFDTQELDLVVENSDLETSEMVFVNDADTYQRSKQPEKLWAVRSDVEIPEFHLKQVELEVGDSLYKTDFGDTSPDEIGDESHYSRSSVKLYFQRDFMPYVFKILIPLAVIVAMAYLVFFLPAKEVSTASGIAITALLSCIAFNVAVTQNLPDVGYLVVSDKFFMATYVLIFLTLVQSIATYALDERGEADKAQKIDRIARITYPILFIAMFAYLLAQASSGS